VGQIAISTGPLRRDGEKRASVAPGGELREYVVRNLPNLLSMGRLLSTIPLVVLVLINTAPAYLGATALFALGSITDTLDGRIARRYHVVSRLGVFLDLTADKIFVAASLIALVQVAAVPAWIAIIIVTREFLVQGLRSLAAAQGVVIPAGPAGKQKTLITLTAIGGILLSLGLGGKTAFPLGLSTAASGPHAFADYLLVVSNVLLLLAVVWTLYSAYEYLRGAWGILTEPAKES
jgi:CDP-diacylglycerol--glycerol-3-phosphate 3-phosphatidyltransferase